MLSDNSGIKLKINNLKKFEKLPNMSNNILSVTDGSKKKSQGKVENSLRWIKMKTQS